MLYHHHGIGKTLFICYLKHTGDHSYNYDHFFTAGAVDSDALAYLQLVYDYVLLIT